MTTRDQILAELDHLNDDQLDEVRRHVERLARSGRVAARANGHIEEGRNVLQRIREIQIDAPADFSERVLRARCGE